jgi:hypothetical protein
VISPVVGGNTLAPGPRPGVERPDREVRWKRYCANCSPVTRKITRRPTTTVWSHPQGVSKFEILSIDEDGHALIESLVDSPGTYPFSVRVKFLVPVV